MDMSVDVEPRPDLVQNPPEQVSAPAVVTELHDVPESKRRSVSDQDVGVVGYSTPPMKYILY